MGILQKIKDFTASRAPAEPKTIKLGDREQTFYFKRINYFDAAKIDMIPANTIAGKIEFDPRKFVDRNIAIIAASLTDENGTEQVAPADLEGVLDSDLGIAMLKAANEVNGFNESAVEDATKN